MHQDRAKFAAEALFFLNTTWLSCYHMQTTVKRDKQTVNYGTLGLQEILTKKKIENFKCYKPASILSSDVLFYLWRD